MVIKNICWFVFFCLSFFRVLICQEVDWSEKIPLETRAYYPEILGSSDHSIFTVRTEDRKKETIVIEKFGPDLRRTGKHALEIERDQSREKILLSNQKIRVFYTRQKGRDSLLLYSYNLGLDLKQSEKFLWARFKAPGQTPLMIREHPGDSLFSFVYSLSNKGKIFFHLFSYDGKLVKRKILDLDKTLNVHSYLLVKDRLFVLIREKVPEKEQETIQFSIVEIEPGKEHPRFFPLFNENKWVEEGFMDYDKINEQLIFNGFYHEKGQKASAGVCYAYYPLSSKPAGKYFIPFHEDFLEDLLGRNMAKNGLEDYKIRQMVLRSDGGTILIAERVRETEEIYHDIGIYGFAHSYTKHYYFYQEIIILSINPGGRFDWSKVIRKDQVSNNDRGRYSSFLSTIQKNKIIFLFNDLSRSHWNLLNYQLTPGGKIEGNILVKGRAFKSKLILKKAAQIAHDEVIIPGFTREDAFVLLRVRF